METPHFLFFAMVVFSVYLYVKHYNLNHVCATGV